MPRLIDLAGQRFGRLTVLSRSAARTTKPHWICRCDCGNIATIYAWLLRSGKTQSCGCLLIDVTRERSLKHGNAHRGHLTPEYNAWINMRQRCGNKKRPDYRHYGGRGIRVCRQWVKSFDTFLADVGRKPFPKATIDRINVNGHYEPSNCRWTTWTEQRRNQRRNKPK